MEGCAKFYVDADEDEVNVKTGTLVFGCGKSIETNARNLMQMQTLKNLIEDAGLDLAIPIVNMSYDVFLIVLQYVHQTRRNSERISSSHLLNEWEHTFFEQVCRAYWQEVLQASNYLDVPHLRTLIEKAIALELKQCKTVVEIQNTLQKQHLLTKEEEQQVTEEHAFIKKAPLKQNNGKRTKQ